MEAERKFKYKYKNLFFLGVSTFIAVFILRNVFVREMLSTYLSNLSYFGVFLAGLFFTYTLTAPIAASVLILISKSVNPLVAPFLGAFGAVVGDYLIFKFVKHHLASEIDEILSKRGIKFKEIRLSKNFRKIVPIIAGFIIASPLPDEIGVALFGMCEFETKKFACFSFFFNFLGILCLIFLGRIL